MFGLSHSNEQLPSKVNRQTNLQGHVNPQIEPVNPSKSSGNFATSNHKISQASFKGLQVHNQDSYEDYNSLWRKANGLLQQDNISEATIMFRRCVEISKEDSKQFIGLGCCEDRIGYHYDTAYNWVKKMKKCTKTKMTSHDGLSICLEKTSDYEFYSLWYNNQIIDHPNDYRLIYGLANLEYNNKKYQNALSLYQKVIDLRPEWDQGYQKIANIYCFKLNNDNLAVEFAQKALNLNKQNYIAQIIQALCTKSLEERIQKLMQLLRDVPNYARSFNGLGNAYFNKGDYQQAINMYKKGVEASPRYQHPYYGLGSIYNHISKYQQSIHWYKRCIEVNPTYDYPHYGLGIAYSNKNDIKSAIFWLQKCIQVNPSYDCPYYALGNIFRIQKEYQKAIDYYTLSLKYKPIDPLCFINISLSYMFSKQYQRAYEYLKQAKEHIDNDKSLSAGNIEYIKDQLSKYFDYQINLQKNSMGLMTIMQMISLDSLSKKYQSKIQEIFKQRINKEP